MIYKRGSFTANASQSAAIVHPLAPLMIIAGAGTGKTTTLLHRIYHLIEHFKLKPENILTITYTEKAAAELKTRIVNEIGSSAEAMLISTFHAFCFNLVKEYDKSFDSAPILMEEGDAIYLFLQNFDELSPFESRLFVVDPVKSITKSFIPFINRLRDELIDPNRHSNPLPNEDFSEEMNAQLNDLRRIYPLFQKWKIEQNFVDFGDMILKCHELLQNDKSVLNKVQDQFKYIIIDEFQDNNFALNEVVKQIVRESGQISVVGDEDQVVYSFRGASKYNISAFRNTYQYHENYAEISLAENFRSTQQILDVANNSIANAENRKHKQLKAFDSKNGEQPQLIFSDNKYHPKLIADQIKTLVEKYNYSDIAVLCRTQAQVKSIAERLSQSNIPTRTFLVNFFEIPEIRDLMAWCNLIAETTDQDTSLYRLISQKINNNYANELFSKFSKRDRTSRLEYIKYENNPILGQLINNILYLRELNRKKTAHEMIWEILIKSKLLRSLINKYEYQDQLAILNIGQFIARANAFSERHKSTNSLSAFTKYIQVLQDSNGIRTLYPMEKYLSQSVLVNTIHGVKGGEYAVVFIPFNRSGSFPLNFRKNDYMDFPPMDWLNYVSNVLSSAKEQHIEEERRLFYVSLTRAKNLLYLYAPKKATSKFIKELNQNLLEVSEMDSEQNNTKLSTYSDLRTKYEKKLSKALSLNQFQLSKDILNVLERITQLENGSSIKWSNTAWEDELQAHLNNDLQVKIPEKINLSASSIETYEQCPFKYRLSNIDKIPQVGSKPQLTFGNIIHRVLEQYHQPDSEQSKEYLLKLLDTNWESLGFDYETQEADFKRQGKDLLSNYFDFLQDNPADVAERELPFSFEIENVVINGKIDRIDKVPGGYNVIDYKTSKNTTEAKKSVQLAIYSLYLHLDDKDKFSGIPKNAILHFLRSEEPVKAYSFNENELDVMQDRIIDIAKNIRDQKFPTCKGFHCDWCDYKNLLCPEWETD